MFCIKCQEDVEPEFSQSGPHIKASCQVCGAYIKFVPKATFEDDTDGAVVSVDTDDVCEVRL